MSILDDPQIYDQLPFNIAEVMDGMSCATVGLVKKNKVEQQLENHEYLAGTDTRQLMDKPHSMLNDLELYLGGGDLVCGEDIYIYVWVSGLAIYTNYII